MSWTALIVMCRLVPRKRDGDQRLTRRPCPRQGLPADQCAPQRQERLVDVSPFLVADVQAAKLTQPRKRPFHYPAPASQATAVPRSTLGQRVNVTGPPDRRGWPPRHTDGRRGCSPEGSVVALARLGAAELRRPAATLLSSHAGWHQPHGRPAAPPLSVADHVNRRWVWTLNAAPAHARLMNQISSLVATSDLRRGGQKGGQNGQIELSPSHALSLVRRDHPTASLASSSSQS
jgi:hypothetical protein